MSDEEALRRLDGQWFELVEMPGVNMDQPGIYEWRIGHYACYIGQYTSPSRPLRHYRRNVRRIIQGLPYRRQNPDGFRRIHLELAEGVRQSKEIQLLFLENIQDRERRNQRERELIAERFLDMRLGGQAVLNGSSRETEVGVQETEDFRVQYCWRCRQEVPVLKSFGWGKLLDAGPDHDKMLMKYNEMTGFGETNFAAVLHHRTIDFGPPCDNCSKPLRTPRAKLCAECGHHASDQAGNRNQLLTRAVLLTGPQRGVRVDHPAVAPLRPKDAATPK